MKTLSTLFVFMLCSYMGLAQIQYSCRFSSDSFQIKDTLKNNKLYSILKWSDGLLPDMETGYPQLLHTSLSFIIPFGYVLDSIELLDPVSTEYNVVNNIIPAQIDYPTCIGCPVPGFVPDTSAIYTTDRQYPQNIEGDAACSIYNNCKILTIPITPFRYNAFKQTLLFYNSFDLIVHLKPDNIPVTDRNLKKLTQNGLFAKKNVLNLVVNKTDYDQYSQPLTMVDSIDNSRAAVGVYEYIVLSSQAYKVAAEAIVEWKRKKGLDAGFIDIADIYENYPTAVDNIGNTQYNNSYSIADDAAKVRMYLKDAFENGAQWLLIVGDEDIVPVRKQTDGEGNLNPTDKYYGNFTGDWEVDGNGLYGQYINNGDQAIGMLELFVGRIPCNNVAQFNNWLTKLLLYEQNPGNGQVDYLTQCIGMQGDEFQQSDDYTNVFKNNTDGFYTHTLFQELPAYNSLGDDLTAPYGADIINYYNQHPPYLWIWLEHGLFDRVQTMSNEIDDGIKSKISTTEFDEPGAALSNLTNTGKPGVVFSTACLVAAFEKEISGTSMCMAESYLVNSLSGGVCFMGGTNTLGLAGGSIMLNYFATSLKKIANDNFDHITHLGSNYFYWSDKLHLQSPGISGYFTHNLFGDPEARLFTETPTRLLATVNPRYIQINTPADIVINLSNLKNNDTVYVSLYGKYLNNGHPVVKTVKGNGNPITVTFNGVLATQTSPIYVTISGFNYLPFTDEILVSPGCAYVNTPENITTSQTWGFQYFKDHNVVVKQGVTLTITGEVYFSPLAKLIVERGARLVLDGGTLGTSCNDLWQGVEVWGAYNLPQNILNQGVVEIKNNGCITNAVCAIRAKNPAASNPAVTTGGMVAIHKARFVNNKCAISLYPLYNTGAIYNSFINNSLFSIDNNYILKFATGFPTKMIALEGFKTTNIEGCTFANTNQTLEGANRGIAIGATNAGLKTNKFCIEVSPLGECLTYSPMVLDGWHYAIYSTTCNPYHVTEIVNSSFNNNLRGIYLSGISLPKIHRNTFKTRQVSQTEPSSALYLDGCTGYSVQENTFEGNYGGLANTFETGIVINNSGAAPNEIYNNTFTKLQNGITAQDDNRGLVCKCNDYSNVKADESVLLSPNSPSTYGVALYQGDGYSVSGPAGNTFSMRTSGTGDLDNDGVKFNYYHHQDIGLYRLKPIYYTNVDRTAYIADDYIKQTACPSKLGGGGGINQELIKNEMASTGLLIDQKQDSLVALIDGGNTAETAEDVIYSSPLEALDLRDALLSKSPYLSDTVMQSAVANEYVLPNAMIRDILVANPQSATSDPVLDKLDKRIDPMPDEMYNQILDGEYVISFKKSKEAELSSLKLTREAQYNTLVTHYMADTAGTLNDSLDQFLMNENKQEARYLLACKQLFEGDTGAAGSTLEVITAAFDLSPAEIVQHENYLSYFAVVSSMMADNLPGTECDSFQLAALNLLMQEGYEPVSSYSRNLLIANGAVTYNEPYLVADDLKSTRVIWERRNVPPLPGSILTLNPNPCNHFVIAGYSLEDKLTSDAFLTISTLQGTEIKTIQLIGAKDQVVISLNNFSPGVYVASLKAGGKLMDSKKIILVN